MGADSFIKSQMHRRPTYDEVIYDAILNPTDKIKLPDRMATQLRNTHQLTRFDEVDATIDLAAEQDRITKRRLTNVALEGMGVGPNETMALKRAEAHKATQTGWGTQTGTQTGSRPSGSGSVFIPPAGQDLARGHIPTPPTGWMGRVANRVRGPSQPEPTRGNTNIEREDPFGWAARGRAIVDEQNRMWDEEQNIRNAEEQVAMKEHRARKLEGAGQVADDHLRGNPLDWWPFWNSGTEPTAPPKAPSEYDIGTEKGSQKSGRYPDWDHKKPSTLGGTTLSHKNDRN